MQIKNQRNEGKSMKSKTTALLLSVLVGGLGIDRFYLGYTGMGVLKLLTAGCFGILYIVDIIQIATGSLLPADGTPYEEDAKTVVQSTRGKDDDFAALEKAAQLREQGVLTEEEYQKMKAEILKRM